VDRRGVEELLAVYDVSSAPLGARVIAARLAFLDVVRGELTSALRRSRARGSQASARYVVARAGDHAEANRRELQPAA